MGDTQRFGHKLGIIAEVELLEVAIAIALIIEYQEKEVKNLIYDKKHILQSQLNPQPTLPESRVRY